jgi:uncharacterized protein YegL
MSTNSFPGGAMARREMHFIWILDCSGSMQGQKIQSLNTAIHEVIPRMREAAAFNPGAQVLVRAVTFSKGAQWHVLEPTPLERFEWTDVAAGGPTEMGAALTMIAEAMRTPPMPASGLPPVLVLVTDGKPTDDFNAGLKALLKEPWGQKAIRQPIAIGGDADLGVLRKFSSSEEIEPLDAYHSAALVERIRWVSTVILRANVAGDRAAHPLPSAPPAAPAPPDSVVWERRG